MLDRMKPLHVPLPNHEQRAALFEFYLAKNNSHLDESAMSEESLSVYADISEGISPRSIVKVITNARGKIGMRLARGQSYAQLTADDIIAATTEIMKFQKGQNKIYNTHMSRLPPEARDAREEQELHEQTSHE